MSEGDFLYVEQTEQSYQRIVNMDGVRTTVCENRFEIATLTNAEVNEQVAIHALKDWLKWRRYQAQLREPSGVSR
jgi:predicted peroxiredoxin